MSECGACGRYGCLGGRYCPAGGGGEVHPPYPTFSENHDRDAEDVAAAIDDDHDADPDTHDITEPTSAETGGQP